jgi:diacylglycerol kinase family enzyme
MSFTSQVGLRVGVVVNPLARRTRHEALPQRLQALLHAAGMDAALAVTRAPADLPAAFQQFRQTGVKVLFICGGDGTLMTTVSAAIAEYAAAEKPLPLFAILPGGTMNTTARNLGLSGGPADALQRLLASVRAAGEKGLSAVPRHTQEILRVHTFEERPLGSDAAPGCERTRHGCIFGAAMGARFLAAYSRRPSLLWAAILGLRTIGSSLLPGGGPFARWLFERTAATLTIDGEAVSETAFRLLLASTVPDVGLGMRVPHRAGCVPGRFHLIASSLPLHKNALQLGRMQRGQPLLGQPHLDRLAQAAELRFAEPQPLTLDGDLFTATAVRLSLGPPLQVLIP